jgi:hypothetical protein
MLSNFKKSTRISGDLRMEHKVSQILLNCKYSTNFCKRDMGKGAALNNFRIMFALDSVKK